ncbi:hypothetical protein ABT324_12980 [Saccharopolyspora sp. NPDC000359]|uniref:hypothetical protein n=1 Tax=Saccharopolyspora sp. NPDC000359 TaxID=3154251 RepID=UPI0033237E56
MDGFWVQVLIALVAGGCGAGVVLVARPGGRRSAVPPPVVPRPQPVPAQRHDPWLQDVRRCEQAVHRAARAVDAVSSTRARQNLQAVVRRMDAEIPNVRALAELGRGLMSSGGDAVVLRRVRGQLADAVVRFGMVTDHVLEAVVELVADPDLNRVHQQVVVLREQFPLLRPMSAVFGPVPGSTPARTLAPAA